MIYVGVGGQAKKIIKMYVGVNGQAKRVEILRVGVGNQAKHTYVSKLILVYSSTTISCSPYKGSTFTAICTANGGAGASGRVTSTVGKNGTAGGNASMYANDGTDIYTATGGAAGIAATATTGSAGGGKAGRTTTQTLTNAALSSYTINLSTNVGTGGASVTGSFGNGSTSGIDGSNGEDSVYFTLIFEGQTYRVHSGPGGGGGGGVYAAVTGTNNYYASGAGGVGGSSGGDAFYVSGGSIVQQPYGGLSGQLSTTSGAANLSHTTYGRGMGVLMVIW